MLCRRQSEPECGSQLLGRDIPAIDVQLDTRIVGLAATDDRDATDSRHVDRSEADELLAVPDLLQNASKLGQLRRRRGHHCRGRRDDVLEPEVSRRGGGGPNRRRRSNRDRRRAISSRRPELDRETHAANGEAAQAEDDLRTPGHIAVPRPVHRHVDDDEHCCHRPRNEESAPVARLPLLDEKRHEQQRRENHQRDDCDPGHRPGIGPERLDLESQRQCEQPEPQPPT